MQRPTKGIEASAKERLTTRSKSAAEASDSARSWAFKQLTKNSHSLFIISCLQGVRRAGARKESVLRPGSPDLISSNRIEIGASL
jgi:hypothetical protein